MEDAREGLQAWEGQPSDLPRRTGNEYLRKSMENKEYSISRWKCHLKRRNEQRLAMATAGRTWFRCHDEQLSTR